MKSIVKSYLIQILSGNSTNINNNEMYLRNDAGKWVSDDVDHFHAKQCWIQDKVSTLVKCCQVEYKYGLYIPVWCYQIDICNVRILFVNLEASLSIVLHRMILSYLTHKPIRVSAIQIAQVHAQQRHDDQTPLREASYFAGAWHGTLDQTTLLHTTDHWLLRHLRVKSLYAITHI